ncbi:MAG TPA: phage major capsid protein, partial [Candidatus Acidoferrales bacterium]|nr:phage major capsid protein [Candidatus Acidoferrales bacterium]
MALETVAAEMAVRRHLELGFLSELKKTGDVSIAQLKEWRKATLSRCKRLLERTQEGQRDFTPDECLAFDEGMALCDAWEKVITQAEERGETHWRQGPRGGGRRFDPAAGAESGRENSREVSRSANAARFVGRDAEGRLVRGLAPEESLAAYLRESGEVRGNSLIEKEGLGLGDIVRAVILGPRNDFERRALAESSVGAGGATVPDFLAADVIDLMRAQTRCVQAGATTVPLRGHQMKVARLTGDPGFAWHAENAADIEVADPTFDQVTFTARTLAGIIRVSRELLNDSLNLNNAITTAFANSFAVELDRACLLGSGSGSEPKGIKNTANVGSVTLGTTDGAALTNYDPFIDSVQTLLDAKANMPTAFIMPPRTFAKIGKLKDKQDQPLRAPDVIRSIPMLYTQSLPTNETQGSNHTSSRIIA